MARCANVNQQENELQNRNKLVFFPSPPNNPLLYDRSEWEYSENYDNNEAIAFIRPDCDLINSFDYERAEYSDEIQVFGPVLKGKPLDVISMLCNKGRDFLVRNNGDRVLVDSLKGKYIHICCFFLPVRTESTTAGNCLDMIAAYSRLSVERKDEFEMVMVAKMRPNWVDDEDAFNHFFSAFPCLAIPFGDEQSREIVCRTVSWDWQSRDIVSRTDDDPWEAIYDVVVDPQHIVLQLNPYAVLREYGACAFPFTDERLKAISEETNKMETRVRGCNGNTGNMTIPSLNELLCLNSSDFLKKNDRDEFISVFDLSKKCVGLYLCNNGRFLRTLHFFDKQCKAKGLEFEIVLVYLPFEGDTKWFNNRINEALAKYKISWWILPFDDSVSRWLCRFWSDAFIFDVVMILGPDSAFVETFGREVMYHFGIEEYPFTIESIIQRKLSKLQEVTLESILITSDEHDYVVNKDTVRVPVPHLRGKNILLYICFLQLLSDKCKGEYACSVEERELKALNNLVHWYPELKAKYPDLELVFVGSNDLYDELPVDEQLIFSLRTYNSESAREQMLRKLGCEDCESALLVAFGKDGRLLSRVADKRLTELGVNGFTFKDYLRQEFDYVYVEIYRSHLNY